MSVFCVNVLDKHGETVLWDVPMHVNESNLEANCILWGEDCDKLVLTRSTAYAFSMDTFWIVA